MTSKFVDELAERGLLEEAQAICKVFALRVDELRSPSTAKVFVQARKQLAELLIKRGWSSTMVGDLLNRDHSSVLSLVNEKKRERRKVQP